MGVYAGHTACQWKLPTYMGEVLGKLYTHTGDAKLKNDIFILLLCVPIVTEYKLSEGCESPTN